jgi:hypothetical protein
MDFFSSSPPPEPLCCACNLLPNRCKRNFMVTLCINDIKHFIVQLMHTTLKNVEILKHFKMKEATPTCFGLQGNHHQGATDST